MQEFNSIHFTHYKDALLQRSWRSGEIILSIRNHGLSHYDTNKIIKTFFDIEGISTENRMFQINQLSQKEAIASIRYGFSVKTNYTSIDYTLTAKDVNYYAYGFPKFFDSPSYFSIDTRISKVLLDLNDFWEVGGAIAIDKEKVGILWINDLYYIV